MANDRKVSLNLNVRGLGHSPTLAINERSRALEAAGRHVYRMGLGQSPFPVPVPVVEALRLHAPEKDYLSVYGLPALRKAVAQFHQTRDEVDVRPELVLVGPGSKELMFLLQLVYYGEILLPTPCWVSYAPQARIIGRNIHTIPTAFETGWRITAEGLEAFLRAENDRYKPRLLVLNYPANPSGCTYAPDELEAIARVARRYQLIVLSDEIYGELHFEGAHQSIARFYPEGTIISSGLSKWCGAGGWRLGTFAFPPALRWLMEPMASVASETYTSVSAPIQYAAVRAFEVGITIERYLWHVRRILAYLAQRSTGILRGAGIRVREPAGAFYLFPDFGDHAEALRARGVTDGPTLCERLLEDAGVAILPGASFLRPPGELTARIALVNFDGARALSQSETVPLDRPLPEERIAAICHPVIEATERIAAWVQA